jgi:xanthine dehydrogenase YagS FAD-binding subunit
MHDVRDHRNFQPTAGLVRPDLHRLPGDAPKRHNTLDRGDLITAIEVPAVAAECRSHYPKVRDRQSNEFAFVSVAVVVTTHDRRIHSVRLALAGAAHKRWRLQDAEEVLWGAFLDDVDALKSAISLSFVEADGYFATNSRSNLRSASPCVL